MCNPYLKVPELLTLVISQVTKFSLSVYGKKNPFTTFEFTPFSFQ